MSARWQRIDLEVPPDFTSDQRRKVADLAIDYIITRTQKGRDKNGDKFPAYSPQYIDSLDFKIGGKSARSVDLTLSGDMLASIELLRESRGKITIGFEKDSEENARADGNIRGTYGKKSGDPDRARDFLGIDERALNRIIREVE